MTTDEDFFESKDFLETLAYYERSLAKGISPFMDADDLTNIADYYSYNGRKDEAHEAIDLALYIHPGATTPLVFKTREALLGGDLESAVKYVEMIVDKNDTEAHFLKAEIMIVSGKSDEADEYLEEYYKLIDNDDEEYDFAYDVANIWYDYQQYDKSYKWTMRMPDDESKEKKELIGRIQFGMRKYTESIKTFEEIIDKHPFSLCIWYSLASAQYMINELDEALKSIDFAIAIKPDHADSLMLKANILLRKEMYEQAAEFYNRYIKLIPDDMLAYVNIATCYQNIGQFEKARQLAYKAVSNGDREIALQACEELMFIELACNNIKTAIEWAEMTEQFSDDAAEPLVLKGHILLYQKHPEDALQMFQDALSCTSNENTVKMRMVASFLDNGYRDLGLWAIRYYYKGLKNITDMQLASMTPEKLIEFIRDKE